MLDDRTPRNLPERTGRHLCVRCLADVPVDDYLRNDHLCDRCAERVQSASDTSRNDQADER